MSEVLGLPVEFAGCAQVEEPAGFCRFRFAGKSRVGGGAGGGGGSGVCRKQERLPSTPEA